MAVPNIQIFRSDTLTEVGIDGFPIDFGSCNAGEISALPYELLVYNDKTGAADSDPAKNVEAQIVQMSITQTFISDGTASQDFTATVVPIVEDEEAVTVDGEAWMRVDSFAGYGPTDKVYTLNYTTGVLVFGNGANGDIPDNTLEIIFKTTPDSNVYGKLAYEDTWISVKSSGVIDNEITVASELAEKIDDDNIRVFKYPLVTEIVGVFDNVGMTGTNYFTGGSFNADTGAVELGSTMTAPDPYVNYKYIIKDDGESGFTKIGREATHTFTNPIPKQNAKVIFLQVEIPATASTEGGVYVRTMLRLHFDY